MFNIKSLDDIALLQESLDLECKLAAGRDGKGAIPDEFWKTYSAFANTHGGIVLLGIKEKPISHFKVEGVKEPQRLITDLFNTLNNPKKISVNLLNDKDVQEVNIEGKTIIQIHIPVAHRKQKPVYLGENPLNRNTYRRLHDGDRYCDDEVVRRMLAERVEDERDSRILSGFSLDDIDNHSFRIYRQMFRDAKPGHPWLGLDDFTFLKKLRGWRHDRETQKEGLTLAGVLMFGTWEAIQEACPHYFVDYQESTGDKAELRWIDRLVPDGSWSGNVFDFYRSVYRKLTDPTSLKVPFQLSKGQRKDDTPVHEAIREALINTLVHADYSGRLSVLVVKRSDRFGFRNPGNMRIPIEEAMKGGESDCRNRIMHQMFLMVGLGERAGSGIPKIYSGWSSQHWRPPELYEKNEPAQTLLELRMLELLPPGILEQLEVMFGEPFVQLGRTERLILATAAIEQVVNHARMTTINTEHSRDISAALKNLVKHGFLVANGQTRGAVYTLPNQGLPTPDEVFGRSEHLSESSAHLEGSSAHFKASSERDQDGRLLPPLLDAPIIHDLSQLSPTMQARLASLAIEPNTKGRVSKETMIKALLDLCEGHFVTIACLASLVNRAPHALRQQYIKQLVSEKKLRQAFPQSPTDGRQAYITCSKV